MQIEDISQFINSTVLVKSFLWQLTTVIASFLFAHSFYKLNSHFVFSRIVPKKIKDRLIFQLLQKYIYPFVQPLYIIVTLAIGFSIYRQFLQDAFVIIVTMQVVILVACLKFLRNVTKNDFVVNLIGILVISALVLDAFGILMPTVTYLDSFAITLGSVRVSIYLVIKGFVVLALLFWVSSLVSKNSKQYIEKRTKMLPSTKTIIVKFIDIAIYFFIFVMVLKTFGVDLTALAVLGGAVGVGIGFGLQKIASNFISGIILLFEKSIETGDIVEIDGAIYGTIERFSGRYTLIKCFDGKEIMMPNEEFIVSRVVNWTYSDNQARIKLSIGVAYDSDLEQVKQIMMDCAQKHPKALEDPEVGCYLKEFGDSSINFDLYFWVKDINDGLFEPKSDVYMAIWKEFKEKGISIPFPQREIKILNQEK